MLPNTALYDKTNKRDFAARRTLNKQKSASRYFFVQQNRQKVLYLALLRTRERKNTSRYFLVLYRTGNQTESNSQYKTEKILPTARSHTSNVTSCSTDTGGYSESATKTSHKAASLHRRKQLLFASFCQNKNTALLRHSLQQQTRATFMQPRY